MPEAKVPISNPQYARDEARDTNARLQAAQEELRRTLYASDMNVAQAAWE